MKHSVLGGKKEGTDINLKDLLALADEQADEQANRKTNTARLYSSGRLNIASGSYIKADERITAKIANSTLILYKDKQAKRKTNRKTNTNDILFNLPADLRKRTAYENAVKNSKTDGNKEFKDYVIAKQTMDGKDYFIIDLAEHEPQDEQADEPQD